MEVRASRGAAAAKRHHDALALASRGQVQGLIALGRAALALVPLMWGFAYLTGPRWVEAPGHPLPVAALGLGTLVGAAGPWLLLPVGSVAHAYVDRLGMLTVITVLGTRRVDLGELQRVGAMTVSLYARKEYALYLRSSRTRWVLLWLGTNPRLAAHRPIRAELRATITSLAAERPDILSTRTRAMLHIGDPPSPARRFVLGATTVIGGGAIYGAGATVAVLVIGLGCLAFANMNV